MGVWSDLESEVSPPVLPSACPGSGLDGGRRSSASTALSNPARGCPLQECPVALGSANSVDGLPAKQGLQSRRVALRVRSRSRLTVLVLNACLQTDGLAASLPAWSGGMWLACGSCR